MSVVVWFWCTLSNVDILWMTNGVHDVEIQWHKLTNTVSHWCLGVGSGAEVSLCWLPFVSWKPSRQVHTTIKLFLCNSKPTMGCRQRVPIKSSLWSIVIISAMVKLLVVSYKWQTSTTDADLDTWRKTSPNIWWLNCIPKTGRWREKTDKQDAHLSHSDRVMRYVSWNFVNCCTAV